MSSIAICTASVLLLYLNRIRYISLNVRSDIPLLVRYVCANDKVVSICEKCRTLIIFLKTNSFLLEIQSYIVSHRQAGCSTKRRHTLNVACIIANNQQVNRANSIDSTAECYNSFAPGMPRLGKTESNLLIKFILPRRDFVLSYFDKRSHSFVRNSP